MERLEWSVLSGRVVRWQVGSTGSCCAVGCCAQQYAAQSRTFQARIGDQASVPRGGCNQSQGSLSRMINLVQRLQAP
jgi:hypothetical protein